MALYVCAYIHAFTNYPFLFTSFSLSLVLLLLCSLRLLNSCLFLGYRNAGFHGSMMNHPNDDMFILSSQVEYNNNNNNNHSGSSNRQSIGGLVGSGYNSNTTSSNGPYSVYQQHQDKPSHTGSNNRMYFSDELLDDGGGKQDESSLYGKPIFYKIHAKFMIIYLYMYTCRT